MWLQHLPCLDLMVILVWFKLAAESLDVMAIAKMWPYYSCLKLSKKGLIVKIQHSNFRKQNY